MLRVDTRKLYKRIRVVMVWRAEEHTAAEKSESEGNRILNACIVQGDGSKKDARRKEDGKCKQGCELN